jgi:hypothetical protein
MKLALVLTGVLTAIGTMMGALHSWDEVLNPRFIGGAFVAIGTTIAALYVEKPTNRDL